MPQQSRKIALVTGSTDGVGRFVAERLGADGWDVIVHGRDAERGAAVVATIAAVGGGARFLSADLSDLAAVRSLADQVAKAAPRLDLLINNAGIGAGGSGARRQVNAAGVELRFAVNYLAGFALTLRLLPLIRRSAPARIVNVASVGQRAIDFDDVMLERGYSGGRAYMQSKLAQVMFTLDLAKRLAGTRRHGQLPAPRHLHGDDDGARSGRDAVEHGRRRRAGDPPARPIARRRRPQRPLFQRP